MKKAKKRKVFQLFMSLTMVIALVVAVPAEGFVEAAGVYDTDACEDGHDHAAGDKNANALSRGYNDDGYFGDKIPEETPEETTPEETTPEETPEETTPEETRPEEIIPEETPEETTPEETTLEETTLEETTPQETAPEETTTACTHGELERRGAEATCLTQGYYNVYCKNCGEKVGYEELPALGHEWKEVNNIDSTCIAEGRIDFKCTRCGESKMQKRELSAHSWVIDEMKAATCTEAGKTQGKHCSVCNKVETAQQEVAALLHNWVKTQTIHGTCIEKGKIIYTCIRCGALKQEETEMSLTHRYQFMSEQKDNKNVLVMKCKDCQKTLYLSDEEELENKSISVNESGSLYIARHKTQKSVDIGFSTGSQNSGESNKEGEDGSSVTIVMGSSEHPVNTFSLRESDLLLSLIKKSCTIQYISPEDKEIIDLYIWTGNIENGDPYLIIAENKSVIRIASITESENEEKEEITWTIQTESGSSLVITVKKEEPDLSALKYTFIKNNEGIIISLKDEYRQNQSSNENSEENNSENTQEIQIVFGLKDMSDVGESISLVTPVEPEKTQIEEISVADTKTEQRIIIKFEDAETSTSFIETVSPPTHHCDDTTIEEVPQNEKTNDICKRCKECKMTFKHEWQSQKKDKCSKCKVCSYQATHEWAVTEAQRQLLGEGDLKDIAKKKHVCTICTKELSGHNWKKDSKHRTSTCKTCNLTCEHSWKSQSDSKCKCEYCGLTADHNWTTDRNQSKCYCHYCGKQKEHKWKNSDGKCYCERCKTTKEHTWTATNKKCKCSTCGAQRPHDWDYYSTTQQKCSICGALKGHNWTKKDGKCYCKECGVYMTHHSWVSSKKNCKCSRCGEKKSHVWQKVNGKTVCKDCGLKK